MAVKEDKVLDARGLLCPMPIVKAGKEMKSLQPGQVLKIIATDRGAIADMLLGGWTLRRAGRVSPPAREQDEKS